MQSSLKWTQPLHTPGVHQPNHRFFCFKKNWSTVSILRKCCYCRWPGLLRCYKARWCTFELFITIVEMHSFQKHVFFCGGIFPCVVTAFFHFVFAKLVMHFFLLVFVLYFAACCHVCLAKLFIGLFACWFNFYDFMLDYVVPSFFVMCLYITSLIFVAEILTFAFSVCCRCFSNSILVCVDVPTALFYVCFGTVLEYALNCTRQFVLKCCCLLFASFLLILCHHFLLHFFLGMTYLCVLVFPFLLPPQLVFLFSRVA